MPNVLLILADDLGWRDLGCTGSTFYETPAIDRLAADGVSFTQAYASCPVCSPTRAALMTGLNPVDTRITDWIGPNRPSDWKRNTPMLPADYRQGLLPEQPTIAERVKSAGYVTLLDGKWHLGGDDSSPCARGFDVVHGGTPAGHATIRFAPYDVPGYESAPPGQYLSEAQADTTIAFLEKHRDRPFFAMLSLYDVHLPLFGPPDLVEKYQKKKQKICDELPGREGNQPVRRTQSHSTYAAMVEGMDRAVARVLDTLDRLGLREDTMVIFTSDNGGLSTSEGGPTSNAPLRAGKGWPYEGGIRVPLIIRAPFLECPATTIDSPTITTDLSATLLDVVGVAVPDDPAIEGISLLPPLRGEAGPAERTLAWHYPHYGNQGCSPCGAWRQGDLKLIEFYETGRTELYDLSADVVEENDLSKVYPKVAADLHGRFRQWRQNHAANMPTPNPAFDASSAIVDIASFDRLFRNEGGFWTSIPLRD